MKSTMDFFPIIETRSVGVTENDTDTPGRSCRFELMDRENAQMRNFEERYGKSFYEALENFKDSVSIR